VLIFNSFKTYLVISPNISLDIHIRKYTYSELIQKALWIAEKQYFYCCCLC